MTTIGRPSVWGEQRDEMVALYEQGLSRGQIARQFNTSVQTVTRQLRAASVTLEARKGANPNAGRTPEQQAEINAKVSAARKGKGTGSRVVHAQRECDGCGEVFTIIKGKTGSRFCSRACRSKVVGAEIRERTEAEYASAPVLCPCGQPIPFEFRHTRQFCSTQHRFEFQPKRQPDQTLQVTFVCETCGTEHTRRRRKGLPWRFCSNTCAAKHTKVVKHYVVRDMDMVLDSGWEVVMAGICYWLKIPVSRVDRALAVTTESGAVYAPDFFVTLPTVVAAIEVKGYDSGQQHEGWAAWRQEMGPLAIVDHDLLDRLRLMTSVDQVERALMDATTL